ncbi:hypothetical protein [Streptomyces sp. NPDC051662]|uniref:hypothetical protein n=1 Tax=Streptomyces sp. NPDC051662 TaxID=3154750 RepID=UPI00341A8153
MRPDAEDRRRATEDRLRAALAARAALVTHHDLRPEEPPRGRGWGVRRVRRVALAALGVAAAVVVMCLPVLLSGGAQAPGPVPPADTPGVSEPPVVVPTHPTGPSVQTSS